MTHHGTNGVASEVKILFLGQCLQYGYEGVEPPETYPRLAAAMLRSRFPGTVFKIDLKYLYHPVGLKALLSHRLLFTKPDVVVIGLPAMFSATEWRVNLVYEMAPEIIDTARTFMRKLEATMARRSAYPQAATTLLDKTFAKHPPLELAEYERLAEEAVDHARQVSRSRLILMGPGSFNEDTHESYERHDPKLWRAVNQMLKGLAERTGIGFIDVQGVLGEHSGEVFYPNDHRFSTFGHEVVAREVANVLAGQVPRSPTLEWC